MSKGYKHTWRTLAAQGAVRTFATEQEAREHAARVAERTHAWVGIEMWSADHPQDEVNQGWALVDSVGGEPPRPPLLANDGDTCEHCASELAQGRSRHRPCAWLNCGCKHGDTVTASAPEQKVRITKPDGTPPTGEEIAQAMHDASAATDDDMSCPVTDCSGKIEARAPFWMGISPDGRPYLDGIGWAEGGVFSCSHGGEEHVPRELIEKYSGLVAAYCDAAEQMLGAAQGEAQIRNRWGR